MTKMTTSLALYQIRKLGFEYEDMPGTYKERPVVVVSIDGPLAMVTVAKVTGHGPRKEFPGEARLADWEQEGLSKPSTVRCSKVAFVPANLVEQAELIGQLSSFDERLVEEGLLEAGFLR